MKEPTPTVPPTPPTETACESRWHEPHREATQRVRPGFLGYGTYAKGAFWFIGMEEGGRKRTRRTYRAEGRPEQVAKVAASHTGRFLADALMPATDNNGS